MSDINFEIADVEILRLIKPIELDKSGISKSKN
jgi:hypothetical protein